MLTSERRALVALPARGESAAIGTSTIVADVDAAIIVMARSLFAEKTIFYPS
jgi:hypothetical protein